MLSDYSHNSLYATDSLRSKDCSTVQIGIIEILVKWSVEALSSLLGGNQSSNSTNLSCLTYLAIAALKSRWVTGGGPYGLGGACEPLR